MRYLALLLLLAGCSAPDEQLAAVRKTHTISVRASKGGIVVRISPAVYRMVHTHIGRAMLKDGHVVINGRRYILVLEDVERNPLAPTRPAGD